MSEEQQVSLSQALINLLMVNDDIKQLTDKISVKLSTNTLILLKTILKKSPTSLDKITSDILQILEDGQINHKDIPSIIALITDFYVLDIKQLVKGVKISIDDIVDFIQFLMKLIIDLNFIKVSDKENIYATIDASSTLLKMLLTAALKTTNCFSSCFKRH